MSTFSQKEPVALGALVQGALNAILLVLSSFHLASLSGEQTAAIFALANIALIIVVAFKTRQVVFSPYTVANPTPAEELSA